MIRKTKIGIYQVTDLTDANDVAFGIFGVNTYFRYYFQPLYQPAKSKKIRIFRSQVSTFVIIKLIAVRITRMIRLFSIAYGLVAFVY